MLNCPPIRSFQGDYRFLSNFWLCTVVFEGITYSSSEAAYQASKTDDMDEKILISKMSPAESKRHGKKIVEEGRLSPHFKKNRIPIMVNVQEAKYKQNPLLMGRLVETGDALLEEGNWWKDRFWGICPVGSGEGENYLGKILMNIRREEQFYIQTLTGALR